MSKILIVDDEVRILMLIQTLLKGNGYETIAAKSGEEALGILAQGGIDVMITDLRMAPMDGLTLIKKVKETHAKLPMILLTAYASVETAIDAMKCGAFDYLTKPFKVDEMLATVKRAEASVAEGGGAKDADAGGAASRYRFENIVATSNGFFQSAFTTPEQFVDLALVHIPLFTVMLEQALSFVSYRVISSVSPLKRSIVGSKVTRLLQSPQYRVKR